MNLSKLVKIATPIINTLANNIPGDDPTQVSTSKALRSNLDLPKFGNLKFGIPKVGIPIIDRAIKRTGQNIIIAGKEIGRDLGKSVSGAGKMAESFARLDFNGMADGGKQIGKSAVSLARNSMNLSPAGILMNTATNGAMNNGIKKIDDIGEKVIGGVVDGMASNLEAVKDGAVDIGEGIATGNPGKILQGVASAGMGAVMAVKDFTPAGLASNAVVSAVGVGLDSLPGSSTNSSNDIDEAGAGVEAAAEDVGLDSLPGSSTNSSNDIDEAGAGIEAAAEDSALPSETEVELEATEQSGVFADAASLREEAIMAL